MTTYSNSPEFVYGPINAEDLAWIPETRWLVTGGMNSPSHLDGHLYLVDLEKGETSVIFPGGFEVEPDVDTYGEGAPPGADGFCAVGINLRAGTEGVHTLYVVSRGYYQASPVTRPETIEIFSVDARGGRPTFTWVGAIPQAPKVWGNAVAPLPDGGLAATNYLDLDDPDAFDKVYAGEVTGNLKEWHLDSGWEDVPGTECSTPNGVEVSPDGNWYFINSWSTSKVIRVSRGKERVERDEVSVDILPDNTKWGPEGRVLVTGQDETPLGVFERFRVEDICNIPLQVLAIDPATLEVEVLVELDHDEFGTASTALVIGDDVWVGSARSDRIACFRGR
jgi:hypothetical protein